MNGSASKASVTIAIPTIGDNLFIEKALRSALADLPADGEILLSDNASGQPELVKKLASLDPAGRIRTLQHSHRLSMAEHWNRCLDVAQGEYFLLLSDDDELVPGFVKATTDRLKEPDVGFAACRCEWITEAGKPFWVGPSMPSSEHCSETLAQTFKRRRALLPCATMFRRTDLVAVGGYDASFETWADVKAWVAVGARYPRVALIQEPLALYRERLSSLTKVVDEAVWRRVVPKTAALAKELFPKEGARIEVLAQSFLEYLIADIKLKKLVSPGLPIKHIFGELSQLVKPLTWRQKIWISAKLAYLRIQMRR